MMKRQVFKITRAVRGYARKKAEGDDDEIINCVKDFMRPIRVQKKIKTDVDLDVDRKDADLAIARSLIIKNEQDKFMREIEFKRKLREEALEAMPVEFAAECKKPFLHPPTLPKLTLTPPIPKGHCWNPPQLSEDESRARY